MPFLSWKKILWELGLVMGDTDDKNIPSTLSFFNGKKIVKVTNII